MHFSYNEKHFVVVRLQIRHFVFLWLTAERDNLIQSHCLSIPYTWPPFTKMWFNLLGVNTFGLQAANHGWLLVNGTLLAGKNLYIKPADFLTKCECKVMHHVR